jgi:3-hydroxyisobutyrate dehydrogenase
VDREAHRKMRRLGSYDFSRGISKHHIGEVQSLPITNDANIGFIGTGIMGKQMARNLLNAGYKLTVFTRTQSKAAELLQEGATWADNVQDLARNSDIVITMVGHPQDVEDIYFGSSGLINNAKKGTILVDMTASSPILAARIFKESVAKGLNAIDAPVSGGEDRASEASLTIMVGGELSTFNAMLPILSKLGTNVTFQGPAGSGQNTKLCNQIAIASTIMGVCESLSYARMSGLDADAVLKKLEASTSSSYQLSNYGPKMLTGDFSPSFYVKYFIKDLRIAVESAHELGLELHSLKLALSLYERLAAAGGENLGIQALFRLYSLKPGEKLTEVIDH